MSEQVPGASATADQALIASDQAPAGLVPSGFDPSRDDLISRREVAIWLAGRGSAHREAASLPRQSLPDRLRREGSAGTCSMLADQIWTGWGVPDELKRRDSDRSGEAGETRSGSTEGESAGPEGIAQGDPS
jgi:hypothetical protein